MWIWPGFEFRVALRFLREGRMQTVLIIVGVAAGVAVVAATALGAATAVAGLARPRPHQRARLRSFGDVIEAVAVIALVPLVVGVFGIYADLLALFGGGA